MEESLSLRDNDSSLCSKATRHGPSSAVHTADELTKYARRNRNWKLVYSCFNPLEKRWAFLTFLNELNSG
jgi:hypothetical protein